MSETYRIVRFHRTPQSREIVEGLTGLSLEEAKDHCQDPATSGDGWFDGFEKE